MLAGDARRRAEPLSPDGRSLTRTSVVAITLAVATLLTGCVWSPSYPEQLVTPDVIGILDTKTNPASGEDFSVRVTLVDGESITLEDDDTIVGGVGNTGDLILYGTQPDPWYLLAGATDGDYSILADGAFSDADAVILIYKDLPGVGIKLPKATDFAEAGPVSEQVEGHLRYGGNMGFAYREVFEINAAGEIVWRN